MKRDEHQIILSEILGNVGDVAKVSENLTKLSEDYGGVNAELELTKAENAALKTRNETVVQENMRLFLKLQTGAEEEKEQEKPEGPPDYETLFNANGTLK